MKQEKLNILVDGNCIICDKEIAYYKRLEPSYFELIDISKPEFSAENLGLNTEAVNKHMHVIMPDGSIVKGVNAFLAIWEHLGPEYPRFQQLRRWISMPLIRPLALIAYECFACIRVWLPKRKR